MFSQKRKRAKGWLFLIPLALLLIFGIWINSIDDAEEPAKEQDKSASVKTENDDEDRNEIPIFEYNNVGGDKAKSGSDDKDEEDDNDNNVSTGQGGISQENDLNSDPDDNLNGDNSDNDDYNNSDDSGNDNNESAASDTAEGGDDAGYDRSKGKIWVISRGDTVVVQTYDDNGNMLYKLDTDIDIDMLPEYDRKALEKGMYLNSEDELYEMLQDFEG